MDEQETVERAEATSQSEAGKPLLGTDKGKVDDRGRAMLSQRMANRLGKDFVVTLGDLGCLVAYSRAVWDGLYNEVMSYPSMNIGRQNYTRLVFGYAQDDLTCDSQHRLTIPARLRKLVKLEEKGTEFLAIGVGDRLEIWAKSEFEMFERFPDEYGRERRSAVEKAYNMMTGVASA
jgi:division/cell wall cluster transcriptional repressor MraZ